MSFTCSTRCTVSRLNRCISGGTCITNHQHAFGKHWNAICWKPFSPDEVNTHWKSVFQRRYTRRVFVCFVFVTACYTKHDNVIKTVGLQLGNHNTNVQVLSLQKYDTASRERAQRERQLGSLHIYISKCVILQHKGTINSQGI